MEPNELSINIPAQASLTAQLFGNANVIGNIDEADDSLDITHQSQLQEPHLRT